MALVRVRHRVGHVVVAEDRQLDLAVGAVVEHQQEQVRLEREVGAERELRLKPGQHLLVVRVVPGLVDDVLHGLVLAARLRHPAPEHEVVHQLDGRAGLRVVHPDVAGALHDPPALLELHLVRLVAAVVQEAPADLLGLAGEDPVVAGRLLEELEPLGLHDRPAGRLLEPAQRPAEDPLVSHLVDRLGLDRPPVVHQVRPGQEEDVRRGHVALLDRDPVVEDPAHLDEAPAVRQVRALVGPRAERRSASGPSSRRPPVALAEAEPGAALADGRPAAPARREAEDEMEPAAEPHGAPAISGPDVRRSRSARQVGQAWWLP